jgi:hypothetical protein
MKVFILIKMGPNIKDNGSKINNMEMVLKLGLMVNINKI